MTDRATPFALVFQGLATERFPEVTAALARAERNPADRDAFVLAAPVGRLLREVAPPDGTPDALEAHVRLLHHAYRHWTGGGWVYRVRPATLDRALAGGVPSSHPARAALYLQLPAHRVWRPAEGDRPAEPLDGMFVTETAEPGRVAVLGVFGMHTSRPGFSAVAVDGRADADDAGRAELEVAARRDDGSPAFAPLLPGGERAGVHSVTTAGELLLLTCRLLDLLPAPSPSDPSAPGLEERFVTL